MEYVQNQLVNFDNGIAYYYYRVFRIICNTREQENISISVSHLAGKQK